MLERVKTRLELNDFQYSDALLQELLATVRDRVLLRIGGAALPLLADSIVVDATVKAVLRQNYEGIKSESLGEGGSLNTTFIDDILEEYEEELATLKKENGGAASLPVLRFI